MRLQTEHNPGEPPLSLLLPKGMPYWLYIHCMYVSYCIRTANSQNDTVSYLVKKAGLITFQLYVKTCVLGAIMLFFSKKEAATRVTEN